MMKLEDVIVSRERLVRNIKRAQEGVLRDYANGGKDYFDKYLPGSDYIIEEIVSEREGWKSAGVVLTELYGVTVKDLDKEEQVEWNKMPEDFIGFLSQIEGVYDWIDSLESEFNEDLKNIMREEGIPGDVYFTFHDGAYVLKYSIDQNELDTLIDS